ncbi:hypothetical protein ACFSJW_00565 [Flavobacterium artemisiae]|uniref:Uncharacterized protein n=1 Tax=Flavobacterium artemisiae TaxID=2126556 RepID=A0ABW4HI88_9FLAO
MKNKLKIVLLFIPFVFFANCKKSSQNLPAKEILAKDPTVTKNGALIEKNYIVVKTSKLLKVKLRK